MLPDYQKLKPLIANYVFDEAYIYKDFDKKEVVSVSLSSSSFLRKNFTINRINNLINKNGLRLTVCEKGLENSNRFLIKKINKK